MEVRRRYSEFSSLRAALVNLHPTLIIPPIPEKHSMADYAAKPTKAKEDMNIIDLRKRMLGVFLNRCRRMKEVREDGVWWRFLDPNASWVRVEPVARDMWTHHFAERSPTLGPTRNHTQEQHESATAGPCSPYSCPSVASSPIRIGEVTIKLCNLIEWYPYLAT